MIVGINANVCIHADGMDHIKLVTRLHLSANELKKLSVSQLSSQGSFESKKAMSNYRAPAFNPTTKRVEEADWIDERNQQPCSFGVRFGDGQIAHPNECDLIAAGEYIVELQTAASTSDAVREALQLGRDAVLQTFETVKTTEDHHLADARLQAINAAIRATKSKAAGTGLSDEEAWEEIIETIGTGGGDDNAA